jgi:hypothetical protein
MLSVWESLLQLSVFERHEQTHSQQKSFICKPCGKAFFSLHAMKIVNIVQPKVKWGKKEKVIIWYNLL